MEFMIMASDFWKFWFPYVLFLKMMFLFWNETNIFLRVEVTVNFFLLAFFPLTDSSPHYFPFLFGMILSCVKRKQFLIWGHEYSDDN